MRRISFVAMIVLFIPFMIGCKKNSAPPPPEKPKVAVVTTVAGTGESGYKDGPAAFAKFGEPYDVIVHQNGSIYIADRDNHRIRKLTPDGNVAPAAGTGEFGDVNGSVVTSKFKYPVFLAVDPSGNLYLWDGAIYQVKKIRVDLDVSVFACSGAYGFADGLVNVAKMGALGGIVADASGNIYIADQSNQRIRKIANGQVTTIAGTGTPGFVDGNASEAQFNSPTGITIDKQGNLYVCDYNNYRIRKITPGGKVSTLAGGTQGYADGKSEKAQFFYLLDIAIDNEGNLFVIDRNRIRKITPAGEVTSIAGSKESYGHYDGEGSEALFSSPRGLAIDANGNIYVADKDNYLIRKISFY